MVPILQVPYRARLGFFCGLLKLEKVEVDHAKKKLASERSRSLGTLNKWEKWLLLQIETVSSAEL